MSIPDAPWIAEAERTGFYKYGWWNQPREDDAIICDRCGDLIDESGDWFNIDGEILCESCFDEVNEEVRRVHGF